MRKHGRAHVNKCMGVNFNVFMHTQINYTKIVYFGFMEHDSSKKDLWQQGGLATESDPVALISEGALEQRDSLAARNFSSIMGDP